MAPNTTGAGEEAVVSILHSGSTDVVCSRSIGGITGRVGRWGLMTMIEEDAEEDEPLEDARLRFRPLLVDKFAFYVYKEVYQQEVQKIAAAGAAHPARTETTRRSIPSTTVLVLNCVVVLVVLVCSLHSFPLTLVPDATWR